MKITLSLAAVLAGLCTAMAPAVAAPQQPLSPTVITVAPAVAAAEKSAAIKKKRAAKKAGKKARSGAAKPTGKT